MSDDLVTWLRWVLDQRKAEARLLCALAGASDTYLRDLLAEVGADRRILDLHQESTLGETGISAGDCVSCMNEAWPCPTVRLLAVPYAYRPGYREEWRP